ncbi:MAG: hypothetical protein KAH48_01470 [Chlorobi bacterium]|nr:hypothetical protein [Chlorobiota bacterium]
MKKILVMMVFVLGMMLGWVGEAEAQCPTGFTPMTVNIDVGGCPYEVQLCVKCSLTGYTASSVMIMGIMPIPMTPACVNNMPYDDVVQYVELFVTNPDYYYTYVCTTNDPPPCPAQSGEIELYHWNCWKIELIEYFGDETLHFTPCGDTYCYEKITWCYDANFNKYNRTVVDGPTQVGEPECTLEAHEIEVPTVVGEFSECFIYPTACD